MTSRFPELTDGQNCLIDEAREKGFCAYFPCYPHPRAQAENTYWAAVGFLKNLEPLRFFSEWDMPGINADDKGGERSTMTPRT